MDVKEPKDVEVPAHEHAAGGQDAHFVLIPKPSTHSRDPLVCALLDPTVLTGS